MTEPLPDTWNNRDLPVLRIIVQAFEDEPSGHIRGPQIAETLGMAETDVRRAIAQLLRGEYVRAPTNAGSGAQAAEIGIIIDITEKALRAAGAWPTPETALDRMTEALKTIARNASGPEKEAADVILTSLREVGGLGASMARAALTGEMPTS